MAIKKRCKVCDKPKLLQQFVKDTQCKDGYRHICLTCRSKQRNSSDQRRRYKLSDTELAQLRQEAGGRCMLCEKAETRSSPLHIDHNHTTGKVRGMLCHHCNILIWAVHENHELAILLASRLENYLERTSS